jgi:protein-S-isoprenylcysteine O-methyltransferase Ste14
MGPETFGGVGVLSFIAVTAFLVVISRRSLANPRCHGFYRFFTFEGTLALVLLNSHVWTNNPNLMLGRISLVLLYLAIAVAICGLWFFRRSGGHSIRRDAPENFSFENTATLVTWGIYGYIRHPMYTSLMLLAWGAFAKEVTVIGVALVLLTTALSVATAKVEERENLEFFGESYRSYMRTSKMFIPYLF